MLTMLGSQAKHPAEWDSSGIMTFLVNHQGVVCETDLGPNTAAIARGMKTFNPDSSWNKLAP